MCHGHQGQERCGVYSVEPGDAKGLETSTQSLREYMGSKVPLQDRCRTSACRHRRSVYSSVRALWAGAEGKTRAEHKAPLGGERRRLLGGFGVAGKAALDEEDAVKAADQCSRGHPEHLRNPQQTRWPWSRCRFSPHAEQRPLCWARRGMHAAGTAA